MSNINNQTKDLYSIEFVQDLDQETAATVSGGALILTTDADGEGTRRTFTGRNRSLGSFNNITSWYEVTGNRDWVVYTGRNFTGRARRLGAGKSNNLPGIFNDNIESARPV